MAIFDRLTMKEILQVTCAILHKNFFYDEECLARFLDDFTDDICEELDLFEIHAARNIINELRFDQLARVHFTCYFVSAHLRHTFIHKLHFTDQELHAFESILPKYTGENRYENPKRCTRTHNREFFE